MLLGDSHLGLVGSPNSLALLSHVELDVAVRGQVRRDSTVGSVRSPSAADGSLGGHVRNGAFFGVEGLGLGVRLQVLE